MSYFNEDRDHDDNYSPFPYFHRESNHSDFNRKILFTAIASLSAVLLLVFALHLHARFVLKRQARRRAAAIHHLTLSVEARAARYTEESPTNTGLNPSLIATLPTFLFKQKQLVTDPCISNMSTTECAVCLSVLENEDMLRLLPNCKHSFHVACIDMWLASHSTCPVCRTKVEPNIEPEPREGPTPTRLVMINHGAPSAPVLEGTSDGGASSNISGSPKNNNSRLSSFRRILSMEKSSRRIQPSSSCDDFVDPDLERQ